MGPALGHWLHARGGAEEGRAGWTEPPTRGPVPLRRLPAGALRRELCYAFPPSAERVLISQTRAPPHQSIEASPTGRLVRGSRSVLRTVAEALETGEARDAERWGEIA